MAKFPVCSIAAINVAAHQLPHIPTLYADAFKLAHSTRSHYKLHGDTYGRVTTCFPLKPEDPDSPLEGELFRFTEFDPKAPWFNTFNAEPATEAEAADIKIPDNLRPNLRRVRYIFFPDAHRLVFATRYLRDSFSVHYAERLISQFFSHPAVFEQYGEFQITPEQSQEALVHILSLPQLDHLKIVIKRPNPDGDDESVQAVMRLLQNQHAGAFVQELHAAKGESLLPDSETRKLAFTAVSNGFVEAAGRNEAGDATKENTTTHPLVETVPVDKRVPLVESFREIAANLVRRIRTRITSR